MKAFFGICVVAFLVCGAWLFWPAKPLDVCEDALNAPIGNCDMTKGHLK
jgi:hypothetical protein